MIHLFVDVSGSMTSGLSRGKKRRCDMIEEAMKKMAEILVPLVEKGMKVMMSLHTFATRCSEIFKPTEVTRAFLESQDWGSHFKPTSLTNLWETARVAKGLREKEPKTLNGLPVESTYILMSDGMNTVETIPLKEEVFDVAIGIGTSREYDSHILRQISKSEIESCPDEVSLSATILRYGCSSYMKLATEVELSLFGSGKQTVMEWVSGSQMMFYGSMRNTLSSVNCNLSYVMNGKRIVLSKKLSFDFRRTSKESRLIAEACRIQ